MQTSYGVVWREADESLAAGKLEIHPGSIHLVGREKAQDIPYDELAAVRVGRSAAERIDGRPSVVLERKHAEPLTISTVAQANLVGEIVDRLTELQLGAASGQRAAIVLPLKEGARDAVRSLLDAGPPFDPSRIAGLERHEVLLTASEAVFLFESNADARALDALLAEPVVWQSAAAWRDHLAGPPRIAEVVFSWSRPAGQDDVSFLATPGPGDSDGGDVF